MSYFAPAPICAGPGTVSAGKVSLLLGGTTAELSTDEVRHIMRRERARAKVPCCVSYISRKLHSAMRPQRVRGKGADPSGHLCVPTKWVLTDKNQRLLDSPDYVPRYTRRFSLQMARTCEPTVRQLSLKA